MNEDLSRDGLSESGRDKWCYVLFVQFFIVETTCIRTPIETVPLPRLIFEEELWDIGPSNYDATIEGFNLISPRPDVFLE